MIVFCWLLKQKSEKECEGKIQSNCLVNHRNNAGRGFHSNSLQLKPCCAWVKNRKLFSPLILNPYNKVKEYRSLYHTANQDVSVSGLLILLSKCNLQVKILIGTRWGYLKGRHQVQRSCIDSSYESKILLIYE